MGLGMDEGFAAAVVPLLEAMKGLQKPPVHDVEGRRQQLAGFSVGIPRPTIPDGVEHEIHHIPTPDGYQLPVWRFIAKAADKSKPGPAVIHTHPGGYISLSPEISIPDLSRYALGTGVQLFSVDYRLAPEHQYPIPLEDCWTALTWVISEASAFGVDKTRIGVMGESAGGGLAAGLTLLARDRKLSPPLARQILVYPMLDDRTKDKIEPGALALWDETDNITGWAAYLGPKVGGENVPIYAAPGRVEDVTGLPPLYMDIGQLDIFVRENHAYAGKFLNAGIETEFHITPGLPHGYEAFAPHLAVVKNTLHNRERQLKKL